MEGTQLTETGNRQQENEAGCSTFESSGQRRTLTQVFSDAMSIITHCLVLAFTIYILYLSFQKIVLFSWHPACMTIGAFLLMAEAIMAMSSGNIIASKLKRHNRVRLHFVLQAGAAAFIFAGFLVIFINKNIHNKYHFQSWHSIFGLVTVLFVGVTASGGIVALYAMNLKKWAKPAKTKLMHNVIGIVTFILSVATVILGLFTGWFVKNNSYTTQVLCTIVVTLAAIFTLQSAVKSAFSRSKNIYFSI